LRGWREGARGGVGVGVGVSVGGGGGGGVGVGVVVDRSLTCRYTIPLVLGALSLSAAVLPLSGSAGRSSSAGMIDELVCAAARA
jgi:hypothetical protein